MQIKLLASPTFSLVTSTYNDKEGIALLNDVIQAITTEMKKFRGTVKVKLAVRGRILPQAVSRPRFPGAGAVFVALTAVAPRSRVSCCARLLSCARLFVLAAHSGYKAGRAEPERCCPWRGRWEGGRLLLRGRVSEPVFVMHGVA
jgi:hypothetical protein